MRFVIVTGYSGSGKTCALKHMEDIGFFCVDNLPPVFLGKLADLCFQGESSIDKVAVVLDIRGRHFFSGLKDALAYIQNQGYLFEILFLSAGEEELINRYNFTRHSHPLSKNGSLMDGIRKEAELLNDLMHNATYIIDTTNKTPKQLMLELNKIFQEHENIDKTKINVLSFGFKRGVPKDADVVFDVRFLPNPYNIPELRNLSGQTQEVQDYLTSFKEFSEFFDKIYDMVDYMKDRYYKSLKRELTVAIGCTGGMHRSVAIAELLANKLLISGADVLVHHRDMEYEKTGVKYTNDLTL